MNQWKASLFQNRHPVLYSCKHLSEGFIAFPCILGLIIFVDEQLWLRWNLKERQAAIFWAIASAQRSTMITRLLRLVPAEKADRDAVLLGAEALDLVSSLENYRNWRLEQDRPAGILVGLSLSDRTSELYPEQFSKRIEALSEEQAKLL